jgi:ABC-type oligopeptide transport system substrate-binding subunit
VTAGDFLCSAQRALNPASSHHVAGFFYGIRGARAFHQGQVTDVDQVGVHALDNTTLAVEPEAPVPYLLHMAAYWSPVPRHFVDRRGPAWSAPENILTCGPFLLQSWRKGESLVLVRDPQFPGPFSGNVERVVLHLGYDPARHLRMYERDELDVFWPEELPTAQMNLARQRHAAEDLSTPRASLKFLALDCSRSPFDQARVRRAFALATNRAALSGVASFAAFPATGGVIPPGAPGHVADIALPYDPQEARKELAQAGYPGGRGFPCVTAVITKGLEDALQELASGWHEALGVDVNCQSLEWADFMARMATDRPQLFVIGTSAYVPDPHQILAPDHYLGPMYGWHHEEYQSLTEHAKLLQDPNRRLELYAQAERILVDEAPLVPLMYGISFTLVKPWVTRYPTSLLKWPFWKDVVIEPH